jgi:hypothetical protein
MKTAIKITILLISIAAFYSCEKDEIYTVDDISGSFNGTYNSQAAIAQITKVSDSEINVKVYSATSAFEEINLNGLQVEIFYSKVRTKTDKTVSTVTFNLTNVDVISYGNITTTSSSNEFYLQLDWPQGSFQGAKDK